MSRRGPFFTVLIVALAAIGLAACADDPDPEPVGFTEPGTVFEVDVGDEVTIVLESNVTTGYAWELETAPLADVVRLVDDVYIEPGTDLGDDALVGAGGRQELTFEAVGEGTAELSLWYVRSFDDPMEPADRAVFEILVS